MQKVTHKQAMQRYKALVWPLMTIYIVAVLGGTLLLKQFDPEPLWLAITIALASTIPIVATLFLLLRYFNETDEYSRLQHLRAFAFGAAILVSAIFLVGFLQLFEVIGGVSTFWFGVAFFVTYGVSYRMMGGKECV